jgi:flagellar FliL protein
MVENDVGAGLSVDPSERTEGGEGEAGSAPAGGKKGKGKLLIIAGVLIVLIAGGGVFASGILSKKAEDGEAHEGKEAGEHAEKPEKSEKSSKKKEGKGEKDEKKPSVFVVIPDMTVNLSGGAKKSSFLKLKMSLEVGDAEYAKVVENLMPRIIDSFQLYLRQLRLEDLQGSAGMYRLREELLVRVNKIAEPAEVKDVLFTEMLAQ